MPLQLFRSQKASVSRASGLDGLGIWEEPDLVGGFNWYREVAANRKPAKFRIAAHVPVDLPLNASSEDDLWRALESATPEFISLWLAIRRGERELPVGPKPRLNLLDLCRELVLRGLRHCNFCRWDCAVDRGVGRKFGACKLGPETRVSTFFHHLGEELIYRGRLGSGTVFFTSCNMRCAFCQNGDISADKDNGEIISERALATMARLLRAEGCHNINWVGGDPTIHLHTIVGAIALLEEFQPSENDLRAALAVKADWRILAAPDLQNATYQGKFNVPMLWNSNFFMSNEAMKVLRLLIDIWLPDFKFGPGRCAVELSKTPWYWETVSANLALIHDWGEEFTIRHLVMPGHVECCTVPVLEWVAEHMPDAPVNIMDQYRPENFCDPGHPKYKERYAPLARRPSRSEIVKAFRYARQLGLRFESLSCERNTTGVRL